MPENVIPALNLIGALAFGLVVGWVTSSVFRRAQRNAITDISAVISAVAGAIITALFTKEGGAFAAYCIGVAIGFFYYIHRATRPGAPPWLGNQAPIQGVGPPPPDDPVPPTKKF